MSSKSTLEYLILRREEPRGWSFEGSGPRAAGVEDAAKRSTNPSTQKQRASKTSRYSILLTTAVLHPTLPLRGRILPLQTLWFLPHRKGVPCLSARA